jgi:hypothetical protein
MYIVGISLERRIGRKKNIQKEIHTKPNSHTVEHWPQQRTNAISVAVLPSLWESKHSLHFKM